MFAVIQWREAARDEDGFRNLRRFPCVLLWSVHTKRRLVVMTTQGQGFYFSSVLV